jgi:hypothetical protein
VRWRLEPVVDGGLMHLRVRPLDEEAAAETAWVKNRRLCGRDKPYDRARQADRNRCEGCLVALASLVAYTSLVERGRLVSKPREGARHGCMGEAGEATAVREAGGAGHAA